MAEGRGARRKPASERLGARLRVTTVSFPAAMDDELRGLADAEQRPLTKLVQEAVALLLERRREAARAS